MSMLNNLNISNICSRYCTLDSNVHVGSPNHHERSYLNPHVGLSPSIPSLQCAAVNLPSRRLRRNMAPHGQTASNAEISNAGREGLIGAIHGASTWGAAFLVLGMAGHFFSPVYRNLTIQFKTYIQLSGMTIGSCIEADKRFRGAEKQARVFRKMQRDRETWAAYEKDYKTSSKTSNGENEKR